MAENQNRHALSARQRRSFADRFLIITYERVILVMLKSKVRALQCQVVVGNFRANRRTYSNVIEPCVNSQQQW